PVGRSLGTPTDGLPLARRARSAPRPSCRNPQRRLMLSAHRRHLYIGALRPPAGLVFDEGLGTTYSLDLDTLLTIPLHLALLSSDRPSIDLQDGISVLEALRRTTERIVVF